MEVSCYKGYFVNGYVFHTESYGEARATWNSGVNLKGNFEYYGTLTEVIELRYRGGNKVVLFNCEWRDASQGVRKHPTFDLVDVKWSSRHPGDDVFIFAAQAQQVYMTPYPSKRPSERGWWATWKCKARSHIEIDYTPVRASENESSLAECYQEDEMPELPSITEQDVEDALPDENEDIRFVEVELELNDETENDDSDESDTEITEDDDSEDVNSEYEFDNDDDV